MKAPTRCLLLNSAFVTAIAFAAQLLALQAQSTPAAKAPKRPNILFIVLDDVGIDQLKSFNSAAPAVTPVMSALAQRGVSFSNAWMMPECSPSRACYFTGRYPLRTGVTAAILGYNLPNTQVSPYEATTPRILAKAGYASALIGKYHLGGPDNNPAGFAAPSALGWEFYNGCMVGGPPFIDPTLGGQTADTTLYPCGFPVGSKRGVGWFQTPQGVPYLDNNKGKGYTGQEIVQTGGIPALNASGGFAATTGEAVAPPTFDTYNGYYAWPRTTNREGEVIRSMEHNYMATAQTDDAVSWIKQQKKPWMCSLAYSSIHTPYQQPPTSLYPPGFVWPADIPEGNQTTAQVRIVSNLMLYAVDHEIGRLLVGAGLATFSKGQFKYAPEATNTMVVICGDNGTYFQSMNLPYNPLRGKATPYQAGVTAPVIVSGPLVKSPGRTVQHMVNAVDLFELFGEIAGVKVRDVVPKSHILDCEPMLEYLTNPKKGSIRKYNFTEQAGAKPPLATTWPGVFTIAGQKLGNDILFDSQEICEVNNGEWFGPGAPAVYSNCCEVRANVYPDMIIQPRSVRAVRNERYKLVKSERPSCDSDINPYELYDLKPTPLNPLGQDNSPFNLLGKGQLTREQYTNLATLKAVLEKIVSSEPECPGDGNLDKKVDDKDVLGVIQHWGLPSVFDFNEDGITDAADLQILKSNYGDNCSAK